MKTCNTCFKEKPLTDFNKSKTTKDRLVGRCKYCESVRRNEINFLNQYPIFKRIKINNDNLKKEVAFMRGRLDISHKYIAELEAKLLENNISLK